MKSFQQFNEETKKKKIKAKLDPLKELVKI